MSKKYLAKIIAKDIQGLKLISACCFEAKVKIEELRYLKKPKKFGFFLNILIHSYLFLPENNMLISILIPDYPLQ